jgi:hypothetical protein
MIRGIALLSKSLRHFCPIKSMPLHDEISRAQISEVDQAANALLSQVRQIQLQLATAQSSNSKLLEEATKIPGAPVDQDLTIIGAEWLPSLCLLQLHGLRAKKAMLEAEIAQIRGESDGIPQSLQSRREEARKKRQELLETREDLRTELESIRTENLIEKDELREYIRLNK